MAIGDVVGHLPDGPAAGTIGRIELLVAQAANRGAKACGGFLDGADMRDARVGSQSVGEFSFSNRISQICFHGSSSIAISYTRFYFNPDLMD
jgi:hypothetical protein